MQRTNVIQLFPNNKQKKMLKEMMLLSSCVYNMANYEFRQAMFKQEKVPNFRALQQRLQTKSDYQALGRSYALPRIQIHSETISAWFKLLESINELNKKRRKDEQEEIGLPKYLKNRKTNTTLQSYLVMDNCQYHLKGDYAYIPLSRQMRKKYSASQHFRIKYNGVLRWKGEQARGQIHFKDKKYYMYQAVDVKEPKLKKSNVKASIDLGIKRIMGLYIHNGIDKIFGSKRFYRQWQYLSNIISKEQSKLNLQFKKTSHKLNRLYSYKKKWQDSMFNNVVAKLFRVLIRNNVSEVVIGDVKGILDDNNKGRLLNKMTHNYWSFDILLKKIINKAEEFGIAIRMETEEYTSCTCPVCFNPDQDNKKDRLFLCNLCGFFYDRDIVGARNIFIKSMYGSLQSIHWDEAVPSVAVA